MRDLKLLLAGVLFSTMDTQPLEGTEEAAKGREEEEVWGWLVTTSTNFAPTLTPLRGARVVVGRLEADVLIDERIFEPNNKEDEGARENRKLAKVSRKQFAVYLEQDVAALVDLSSNGTYVNEMLVGRDEAKQGRSARLVHGDTIGLLELDFTVYYFMQESAMKLQHPQELGSRYLVGRLLGSGAAGTVYEVFRRTDHARRAVKVIENEEDSIGSDNSHTDNSELLQEVEVLKGVEHPCITRIHEVLDIPGRVMVVMELAAGGELFDQVLRDAEEGRLEERAAKVQMYQIVHAIAFLHSRNICHRDLKLENILLETPGPTSRIKVTDFGLSKRWSSTSLLRTFVGTPTYMAPEVIKLRSSGGWSSSPYTCRSDCWSLGVILYTLLSGAQPFRLVDMPRLEAAVAAARYLPMAGRRWAKVSEAAKSLVASLLQKEASSRPAAADILRAEWFQGDVAAVAAARAVMGLEEEEVVVDSGVESCGASTQGGSSTAPSVASSEAGGGGRAGGRRGGAGRRGREEEHGMVLRPRAARKRGPTEELHLR